MKLWLLGVRDAQMRVAPKAAQEASAGTNDRCDELVLGWHENGVVRAGATAGGTLPGQDKREGGSAGEAARNTEKLTRPWILHHFYWHGDFSEARMAPHRLMKRFWRLEAARCRDAPRWGMAV